MHTTRTGGLILLVMLGWAVLSTAASMAREAREWGVRRSVLQGSWYPADPPALRGLIGRLLFQAAPPRIEGRIIALVAPHAGYTYSGPVAARAYALIQGMPVERVVLVGPSHRWGFDGVSVACHDAYETPLGRVPVDRAMARRLMESEPGIDFVPEAHAAEHCLEIQLPFLQAVLDEFSIVPVIMGRVDGPGCSALAAALVRAMEDGVRTLLIASTDLSHFHTDRRARDLDRCFVDHLNAFDPEGLAEALAAGTCEACGGGPTVVVLTAAGMLGAGRCVVLDYATSGEVTGDRDRVVGYVSAAVVGDPEVQ